MRLNRSFFNRDTNLVAQELLGKVLVCVKDGKKIHAIITETEAYHGFEDRASHASRKKTERNKIMFDKAGLVYVYLVYGMHHCLNFVTMQKGFPAAILVRSVNIDGKEIPGPGRVCKALGINRSFYGEDLVASKRLWVEPSGYRPNVKKGKRVGIDYAGECADWEWNYKIKS